MIARSVLLTFDQTIVAMTAARHGTDCPSTVIVASGLLRGNMIARSVLLTFDLRTSYYWKISPSIDTELTVQVL
ncbi:hypothetical protein J6590_107178 [Homalodisca vitripennis]|nr:hypothetical protein J6590_107178 [Homalodisca vitripennis]